MAVPLGKKDRESWIRRFGSGLGFPKLFLLLTGLFILDLFVPDPIPFIDEAILGLLAVAVGMWRERRDEKKPPMKNVTPSPSD